MPTESHNLFVEVPPGVCLRVGALLTVVHVRAANAAKDMLENVKNLLGGRMGHYSRLIQDTLDEAMEQMQHKAQQNGYDGVVGIRIASPKVTDGAVEVIIYGNGFNYE